MNKLILGKLDEKKEKGFKPLARCPVSCLIHVCHNSFSKGVKQYGDNAEELCMNLHYFFKNNLCRREDLFEIEETLDLEELVLLCHTRCRWLSLIPALQRLTKVKEAVKKLINDIGRNDKNIGKNDKYLAIKRGLESKEVWVEIEFLLTIIVAVLPVGLSKKKHKKKMPLSEKKKYNFSKKKPLFNIISFLKRVFCLPFLHKISPFNMFKAVNYLFLFFNISKTSYFTKQQTPLMISFT